MVLEPDDPLPRGHRPQRPVVTDHQVRGPRTAAPETFGVLPTGTAGPIATWDPRGTDPNVRWRFDTTPVACAASCAGVAYFSY
ncbi:hypothetical protein BTZ20_2883 [Rhodococcus sp. MTM3W5.2]|nr:hypothetical protein BTZ20_2883 [Rhodococcus sp. MTM3W5.2]